MFENRDLEITINSDIDNIKLELEQVIDYFNYHNKNLTKTQDQMIEKLKDIRRKLC